MALTYERTSTREMDPRPGVKFATTYNRIRPATRRKMLADILAITEDIVKACENQNDYPIVNPLRDFSRTSGRPNYSAADIMSDLVNQIREGRDIPDAMVNRWNKLFAEWDEIQIEFVDSAQPSNNFGELFR